MGGPRLKQVGPASSKPMPVQAVRRSALPSRTAEGAVGDDVDVEQVVAEGTDLAASGPDEAGRITLDGRRADQDECIGRSAGGDAVAAIVGNHGADNGDERRS